jgi:hypothetical protein
VALPVFLFNVENAMKDSPTYGMKLVALIPMPVKELGLYNGYTTIAIRATEIAHQVHIYVYNFSGVLCMYGVTFTSHKCCVCNT